LRGQLPAQRNRIATAGTVIFELKLSVDIIIAEDGKYCVDTISTTAGVAHAWTEGPFEAAA